jgi:hypothetical protein
MPLQALYIYILNIFLPNLYSRLSLLIITLSAQVDLTRTRTNMIEIED